MSACKHKVSGTVSLPSRGAFHLSLTVLLLYRSSGSILAWRVVPPASHGIPRAPRYSGSGYVHFIFDYVALTLFDWPSQTIRLTKLTESRRPQPRTYCYVRFGLFRFRSPHTFGISVDYFSSPYLDVSVQAVPHAWLFDSPCVT